eukprot:CAMPEP_0181170894 /NCGR_PEP_ID=MMETSP1096-20121128/1612_1 /TAXON_ID=156174 ORGANISM="Chrysochromulina ericina, Strain CCMP281" /NCGR_SAMPLE_ID=MMETSP1096 /ASSEMBLY_ACC=CAM_ASM_000453 /LENGTH=156 /DNA_ID=CAMNT_0023258491 /DNA_START=471 /DNA_END=941 /DNA_ORIENTATION=-
MRNPPVFAPFLALPSFTRLSDEKHLPPPKAAARHLAFLALLRGNEILACIRWAAQQLDHLLDHLSRPHQLEQKARQHDECCEDGRRPRLALTKHRQHVGQELQHSHEWEVNGPDQEKRYGEQDAADRIELSQEGAAVEEVRKVIRVEDVDNNQENT